MVGPKSVSKRGRGRSSGGLARLRHEFHRFREEVCCIRSLPSLHRRWPSLARLEIESEASSGDDTLWDSEELTHGIFIPAIAGGETDGIDKRVPINSLQEFSSVGLESVCSTHGIKQECANAQTSPVRFDESGAKCANDWGSEKTVVQFKEENVCNVVQVNRLVSHRQSAESLGSLESDTNSDDIEHFDGGYDPEKRISPCLDSGIPQDGSETLHNAVSLPELQLENQGEEGNYTLDGLGEDATEANINVEDVGNISPHLAQGVGRVVGACEITKKLGELDLKGKVTGPSSTGGTLSLRSSKFDVSHEKDADEQIVYSHTPSGSTKGIADPSLSSCDTNFTEFRSVEACFDDEIVADTLSHSGARVAATAYFTANPRHKHVEIYSVPHRHTKCQNQGSIQVDIPSPNTFTSASRDEAEFGNLQVLFDCNLENHICSLTKLTASPPGRRQASSVIRINSLEERGVTDNGKDMKTHDTQINVSPEDRNRTLKLVGYVYEEVQPKIDQVPDQLVSSKPASLPGTKSTESSSMEFDNQIVHASMVPTALYAERQDGPVEAEGKATVNDLTADPSRSNTTSLVTASEDELNGKSTMRQGGGGSSLIALTGRESLTRLGDESKRDSGLAARMATRIRHALETVGERSLVNDKCRKSSTTEVTEYKARLDKGLFAGYRAQTGIGSSKVERKLGFKIKPDLHRRPKIIGGDSHRFTEGWISSDGSGAAPLSSYTVRPEEPETYLQHVIAALDSGNESDGRDESDPQQDLSASSVETPEQNSNCLHEHPLAQTISPRGHTEEGTDVSCSRPCNAAHDHHCAHGRFPQFHGRGSSVCPLHLGRISCPTVVNQELSKQRHLSNGCIGSPKISCMTRRSAKTEDANVPRVVGNSCKYEPSIHEADFANPHAFSVKVNGSMVEIEVGEEPPSIIWTPRGDIDQSVAGITLSSQSQEQNTTESEDKNPSGAATSFSRKVNSTQVLQEPSNSNIRGTNEDPRAIRFRDPILPGKVSKSVRFHSAAKDSGQEKFYGPEQIHESFGRTVESLARKAQGLGWTEAKGEAIAGSQQPARLTQGRLQASGVRIPPEVNSKRRLSVPSLESYADHESLGSKTVETGEACRSVLKSPRGASESDSEVQHHRQGSREGTQVTGSIRYSEPAIAGPPEIKVRRPTRRSILKAPRKEAFSSSECTSGVYHDEDCLSDIDERKEILGAAAAGLANELQILMRSRIPEYVKNQGELQDDASAASEVHGSRQRLRTHRPKKLYGHFRPRKQAILPQESPAILKELAGHSQPVYHSSHAPHTSARRNQLTGRFRSNYEAGSSSLPSEYQKEPLEQLRSSTKPRQRQSPSQNCITGGEGRDRFAYHEVQHQSQSFLNSASIKRAKQIVRDTLGDVFDYDRFQQVSSSNIFS